jgi:hypothetical protein
LEKSSDAVLDPQEHAGASARPRFLILPAARSGALKDAVRSHGVFRHEKRAGSNGECASDFALRGAAMA